MILSILICAIESRVGKLANILAVLENQSCVCGHKEDIELLVSLDNKQKSTGVKRNELLKQAAGDYVCFIDDDDMVSDDYISEILKAIESNPDVIGMEGWVETNGANRRYWKLGKDLPYVTLKNNKGEDESYLRHSNHLAPVRRSIALQIGYPDKYVGEDYDYAVRLKESGLLKTEVYIAKELYYYRFSTLNR